MPKFGTYIVNQLPEEDTCLCGIHVRKGAKILAVVAIIYSALNLIYSAAASYDKPFNVGVVALMLVNAICAALVIVGERKNRPNLLIPALMILIVNIIFVTLVLIASIALGYFDPDRFQNVLEFFVPRVFINDSIKQYQTGQNHKVLRAAVVSKNPRERVFFHIATTILFAIFDVLLIYSATVIYRAYKNIKNIIQAPVTVLNENYRSGTETTSQA